MMFPETGVAVAVIQKRRLSRAAGPERPSARQNPKARVSGRPHFLRPRFNTAQGPNRPVTLESRKAASPTPGLLCVVSPVWGPVLLLLLPLLLLLLLLVVELRGGLLLVVV